MRYEQSHYDCVVIYDNRGIIRENEIREISFNNLKYNTFELIEDEKDEIDSIEELNDTCYDEENLTSEEKEYYHNLTRKQQNTILRAVKQLNKEIKSIKEDQSNYNQISKCSNANENTI